MGAILQENVQEIATGYGLFKTSKYDDITQKYDDVSNKYYLLLKQYNDESLKQSQYISRLVSENNTQQHQELETKYNILQDEIKRYKQVNCVFL